MASAENVDVQVRHGFAAVRAVVDDEPVAVIEAQFLRYFSGFEQQMAEQKLVVLVGFGEARDGFLWKNQDVDGRLRFDVADGEHHAVFINDVRRNLAGDDFFEKRFGHKKF